MVVLVDDLGYSLTECKIMADIPQPINLAVIPGQVYSRSCATYIKQKTPHQLLIHLPWQSLGRRYKKEYPIRIMGDMSTKNMELMLNKAMNSVPSANGINNHMGSTLSANKSAVQRFMSIYRKNSPLYFIDSNTSRQTKAEETARRYGIPTAKNNFFLDGNQSPEYIEKQFRSAINYAYQHGTVIAICHGNRKTSIQTIPRLMNYYKDSVDFVYIPVIIEERSTGNAH
jgi:polysaccharide deacetylase 2 family uncharacterized protein YibQ